MTRKDVVGVVVSLGVDTFESDPISDLGLTKGAYFPMGRRIAELALRPSSCKRAVTTKTNWA